MLFVLCLPSPAKTTSPSLGFSNPYRPRQPSIESLSVPPHTSERLLGRLIHQTNEGNLHQAVSTLDLISYHGLSPDLVTSSLLLKSCIRSRNFHLGKIIHARLTQSQLELDSVVLNSLITLYSKCGDWGTAYEIFEEMGDQRDVVSWSAMISCFANNGMELRAIETFVEMLISGYYPNEFCYAAVIRACSGAKWPWIGEIIYGLAIKSGNLNDLCLGCALIDMFVKGFSDLDSAWKVFDTMNEKNVVAWSLMISRVAQMGYQEDAIRLFLEMEFSGYVPDRFTLTSVISACSEIGLLSFGKQLHSRVIRSGLISDACVGCSLVDMYAKCGATHHDSLVDSRKVFDRISDRNVMAWTAMIAAYVQCGGHDKGALELFCTMVMGPVRPNHFTIASVLKACANLSHPSVGEQVYCYAVKLGLALDNFVGNSLISLYSEAGLMDEARKAFDILFEKNLVSYNTIVGGYAKNLNSDEAFELFNQVGNTTGTGANAYTFTSLLSGAASVGAGGKGEQIHGRVIKAGSESNQRVCNALISMYSRSGNIEAAYKVFDGMEDRNLVSWTSMITGLAKHGFAIRALEMFNMMVDTGIKPNEITYVAVISACSHVGMVSQGWKHFDSMLKVHGLVPKMEHYACMVDLLGRSGFLVQALELINSMPFDASALVWRTLLGACQVHGDTELGEFAAKRVLELEPDDPAAHTLLSNLYASKGKWEEVAKIRKNLKDKNLSKEAGCSWVEIDNKVHRFYVGDTKHSQAEEIYVELNQLIDRIKEMGYVPQTELVLHDMAEEHKEHYLLQHSEKIAVAYGLISTPMVKPVRIFKNLRVCSDCHTAMKYISKATGRLIILRDWNRFHHFKDGACSCNDYW